MSRMTDEELREFVLDLCELDGDARVENLRRALECSESALGYFLAATRFYFYFDTAPKGRVRMPFKTAAFLRWIEERGPGGGGRPFVWFLNADEEYPGFARLLAEFRIQAVRETLQYG
jgi:hypothetical protein